MKKNLIKVAMISILLIISCNNNLLALNKEIKIDRNNNFEDFNLKDEKEIEKNKINIKNYEIIKKSIHGPIKKGDEKEVKNKIENAYKKMRFPKEYSLSYIEYDEEEQEWQAKFEEEIEGIKNIYKGIKLRYSELEDRIVFYKEFNEDVKKTKMNINKDFIKKNESKYIELIKNEKKEYLNQDLKLNINEAKLEYIKPNTIMRNDIKGYKEVKNIIKVWKVEYKKNYFIYIDIENGNIVGGTYKKYAESLSTTTGGTGGEDLYSVVNMYNAFNKLGYRSFMRPLEATTYILKDWIWRGGPQYAFYFSGHGKLKNGKCVFQDMNEKIWWPSDIKGNWDFVFIDACWSKANDTLANAFRIYNSSRRKAYLGWKRKVDGPVASKFVERFTARIGTAPIQKIAADVGNNMAEYAPIRFTGDRSWYGYAR